MSDADASRRLIALSQPTEVGFVATAVAFSRAFRPTASRAKRAIMFATAINRLPPSRINPVVSRARPRCTASRHAQTDAYGGSGTSGMGDSAVRSSSGSSRAQPVATGRAASK